jgi:hypothetical protein
MSIKNYLNKDGEVSPEQLQNFKRCLQEVCDKDRANDAKIGQALLACDSITKLMSRFRDYYLVLDTAKLALETIEKEILERYAKKEQEKQNIQNN